MKYMGSKSRIKKYIVPILQNYIDSNNIENYIEPFVGGANVIDSIICKNKIGNDISNPLIELFKSLVNGQVLPLEVPRKLYNDVRKNKNTNKYPEWYKGAIGYLSSYNGRYFDGGYAGEVITKTGIVRNYYKEAKRNIEKQIINLKDIKFISNDYKKISISNNSLIYCDPPYENTKQYGINKNFNYEEFWKWVRVQSKNNIVIISEQNAPNDFKCIWEQEIIRTQNNRNRIKATEKLFIKRG